MSYNGQYLLAVIRNTFTNSDIYIKIIHISIYNK